MQNKTHTKSLILQATYHAIEYGLYQDKMCLFKDSVIKTQASSLLMMRLKELIDTHHLSWNDFSFIGINQGPAPFTTLRALIATVNGISFATKIPLIGVDGLMSFATEQADKHVTVVLLNAFSKDLYYGIKDGNNIKTGWANGICYLQQLRHEYGTQIITFAGNGVELFKNEIIQLFGASAHFHEPFSEYVTLETIAHFCFKKFKTDTEFTQHLTPLYLKTQNYKSSC